MKITLSILPILLACAAQGADGAAHLPVGFEVGLGWVLPDDRRFEGSVLDYYLYVAPSAEIDLGYLREEMYVHGRQEGESISARGHVDAVRGRYRIFDDEAQSVRLLASAGYATYVSDLEVGAFAFDLGAEYVPWKIASAPIVAEVVVQVRYRYCRFDAVSLPQDARPVENAGGLIFGIAGDVRY